MNMQDQPEPQHSQIDFHRGNTLMKLSNTYDSLLKTVIEGIQNAIDGMAEHIFVGIDLHTHVIDIADDGEGVDQFSFERALNSVGQTVKERGKLGRFGLGLISPLNKCRSFTFTSSSLTTSGRYSMCWTFDAKQIASQHHELLVPRQRVSGLPMVQRTFQSYMTGRYATEFRTVVHMMGVTEDKVISLMDLDELENETLSKLGNEMRRKHVSIKVVLIDEKRRVQEREITASDYTGEKLFEPVYEDSEAGTVTFSLYRASRKAGVRRGLVSIQEANNPSSISIKDLANQARRSKWKTDVEDALVALSSGYFEGNITASNLRMHPERTKFENNDALRSFYYILCLWYDEYGKAQYKNEQESRREDRYQTLGLQSQKRLQQFLRGTSGERLMTTLRSVVTYGRLGAGHTPPRSGRPKGPESIPSIRTGQGGVGVPRQPAEKTPAIPHPPRLPKADRPGDIPFGTTGPRGQTRQLVQDDSQGLWYEHSPLVANSHLWEFDISMGVLTFNVRHPLWTRLDETKGKHTPKNAKMIMHLQEWLTLQVLNLLVQYPDIDEFEEHRSIIDDQLKLYIEMFIIQ